MPDRTSGPLARLVLVVEDHDDTRVMYSQWLAVSGFRVAEATNGHEALEKAQTLRPDIITTDIRLSGDIDGCQLTETLKSYAHTHGIPIIAVTGWVMGGHIERALQSGCDSVLMKPCLPETLLAEIHRLLKRSPKKQHGGEQ